MTGIAVEKTGNRASTEYGGCEFMEGSKLMDAFHKYQVNYHEFLEKYKTLNETTGSAREELQNQLADWIAETYPLRVRKPAKRKFAESEKNRSEGAHV